MTTRAAASQTSPAQLHGVYCMALQRTVHLQRPAHALRLPGSERVAGLQPHAHTLTQGLLASLTNRHIQSTAHALWAHGMLHQASSLASAQCTPALSALTSGTPESFPSLQALQQRPAQWHSAWPKHPQGIPHARSPAATKLAAHGLAQAHLEALPRHSPRQRLA